MNCLVHRALILYAADYFFSLHNYFSFTVSVCRIRLSLNNNKVYALPIVGLHDTLY